MLMTTDLAKDQVEPVEIAEDAPIMRRMPQAEVKERLEEVKTHIDRVAHIMQDEAEVQQNISTIDQNVDSIPVSHLEELSRLPSPDDRTDALKEINFTAPERKVTAKYFKNVVNSRLSTGSSNNNQFYELVPETAIALEDKEGAITDPNQASTSTSISTPITHQIITIRANTRSIPQQEQYFGCWGIVSQVQEGATTVVVGGESVEYLAQDLEYVIDPSPSLMEVCARVTNLWKIPNLPASVQHLLATFYQQRLDFSPPDLNVLAAIENCVRQSLAIDLIEVKEDDQTNTQNKIKAAGVDNQITSIIFPTE